MRLIRLEIGQSSTKILYLEDLLTNSEQLLQHAKQDAQFSFDATSYYPGLQAALPREYVEFVLTQIAPIIREEYGPTDHLSLNGKMGFFAAVNQAENELLPQQCCPHYDQAQPKSYALLHYLNPGDFGGTGFFRQKATNLECVTPADAASHMMQAKKDLECIQNQKGYMNNSSDHYQLIGQVDYRPNRMIIYPTNILHSGLIVPPRDLRDDVLESRITANVFLSFD